MNKANSPYVVGITGTISSGKSAVGKILEAQQIPVLDSDQIVHYLLSEDTSTRKAVLERFGDSIANPETGSVDRIALGKIVFTDEKARRDLEAIVHPAVILECRKRVQENGSGSIVAILAPLLFEAGLKSEYNEIWTVITNIEILRERLRQRDKLTDSEVERRLAAQWTQEKKASLSDAVIDNSGSLEETAKQVDALLSKIKAKIQAN
ncbi:MAG TPA: dephospho-CoA kinase [Drouetiella sp.]